MRKTKIVCTIGPATDNDEILRSLMESGMNVARLNFSHGTHASHLVTIERIKKLRKELNLPVAIMLDTGGPEIRTLDFAEGKVMLKEGQSFTLSGSDAPGDCTRVGITYKELYRDVKPGSAILIDDGLVELKVKSISGHDINCTVVNGGPVSNHKGINVPNTPLGLPFISEKDRSDILFGIESGVNIIAASFVRCADDIKELKFLLKEHGGSRIAVIAKVENRDGVDNIDEILEAADGVMIARGDLGVEIPIKEIPVIQKDIIKKVMAAGKISITATQMLDSMIHNPRPTRAEVTDVANAIYDGTGAIMLSGETASGNYPLEALKIMSDIAEYTENHIDYKKRFHMNVANSLTKKSTTNTTAQAGVLMAIELKTEVIISVTVSGKSARMISRFRPDCPIIGCTPEEMTYYQLSIVWGTSPVMLEMIEDTGENLFYSALRRTVEAGLLKPGGQAVITAGLPLGGAKETNTITVLTAEE